jgi:hypothetical protein
MMPNFSCHTILCAHFCHCYINFTLDYTTFASLDYNKKLNSKIKAIKNNKKYALHSLHIFSSIPLTVKKNKFSQLNIVIAAYE